MIVDYRAGWEKHGVKVQVYENVSDLEAKAPLPWKTPVDKCVDFKSENEDRPRCKEAGKCQEVTLEDVIPYLKHHPYLYHGANIKVDHFWHRFLEKWRSNHGASLLYHSLGIFYALLYGGRGRGSRSMMETNKQQL
eukprot:Skav230586  [mRNA]  locus=scaffold1455:83552:83959:- [translate_table: standard]